MKAKFLLLVALALVGGLQAAEAQMGKPMGGMGSSSISMEDAFALVRPMLADELGITEDEAIAVETLYTDYFPQLKDIQESDDDAMTKAKKLKALKKTHDESVGELLSKDQRKKLQKLLKDAMKGKGSEGEAEEDDGEEDEQAEDDVAEAEDDDM